MKFERIVINNFMALGSVKLDLMDQGIVLILGRNEDNPSITRNGSGKSSLWDALVWVLYGKTLRGLGGDEVLHDRLKKPCSVKLTLRDDKGDIWQILRTREEEKGKLILESLQGSVTPKTVTDTQTKIESLVGLDYESFVASVVFGQESLRFATATDKEKKQILERLLNLTVYDKACKMARNSISGLKMTVGLSNASFANAQTRLDNLRVDLEKYDEKAKERQKLIKENVSDLIKKLKQSKRDLKGNSREIKTVEESLEKGREIERRVDDLNQRSSLIVDDLQELGERDRDLSAEYVRLKDEANKECPTCGQSVSGKSLQKALKSIMSKREEIAKKVILRNKQYRKLRRKVKRLAKVLRKNGTLHLQSRLNELKTSSSKHLEMINYYRTQIKIQKGSREQSEETRKHILKQIKTTRLEMTESEKDVRLLTKRMDRLRYWEQGFGPKGLRSYLLDNVLPFLNDRADFYSSVLTDGAFRIRFSTTEKLKRGGIAERFSVSVRNRHGSKSYKGNSAGEKQRADLCIALCLKDLARSRSRGQVDLMVFDEVFEKLDDAGCERVIELLNQEKESFGSCFVITHNENLKPFFSRRIEVIKRNGVSYLEN